MKKYPLASLIISTYNWSEALNMCLLSVKEQVVLPKEVIIADDGSINETRDLIKSFQTTFPIPIVHVWHEDDGFRKALIMNKAVKKSTGDYLIMTDGDMILNKYFIKDHLDKARIGYFIQGSRALLTEEKTIELLKTKNQTNFRAFEHGIKHKYNAFRIPWLSSLIHPNPKDSRTVKGCNISLWKFDYILCNGYNNAISGWGHEDIELAARLINNNIMRNKVKFLAICYHIYHKEKSRDKEQENFQSYIFVLNNNIKRCDNGYEQINSF